MTSQTDIAIALKLSAQGIKEATADSEKLNQSLEKGQAIAGRSKAVSAGYKAAQTTSENVDDARAVAGRGGSGGARDFAKESQGLGGLVRLYAVWAANVYAVSTAFDALSKAANITALIEGMNELGVSSGNALGTIAKRFADATGNAISYQQASRDTVRALAAGLSPKQFEAIGEVAAKASRALGVDMDDAITRVTKGITKMQPRLLEELDIFTKINPAVQEYARTTGKSISSITEFEKQQAFANAAIAEGKRKFEEVSVVANPYNKLKASVAELTQSGLELINSFLGPLVGLLASSPTALTGVMVGLGTMLVKQAIPALGQYRESLTKNSEYAVQVWEKKSKAIQEIEKRQYDAISSLSENKPDKKLALYEKALDKLKGSSNKDGISDIRTTSILQTQSYQDISKADIAYLRKEGRNARKAGDEDLAQYYSDVASALRKWVAAEKEHSALLDRIQAQTAKAMAEASPTSPAGYNRDQLNLATRAKARTGIISGVAEDVSVGSFANAWASMNKAIADEKLTGADKLFTKLGGAAVLATTGVTRVISAISGFVGWVGAAVAAVTTLYDWMSNNREQADKLSKSLDYASKTAETAAGTFTKFKDTLTTESLLARSNAMGNLGDSVKEVVDNFMAFDKASNPIDKVWESTKHLFGLFGGFSKQDYLASSLSKQVMLVLDNLDDPKLKQDASNKIKNLLSIDKLDLKTLEKGFDNLSPAKLKDVPGIFLEITTSAQATALAVTTLKDGFKAVDTAFTNIENSLKTKDLMLSYADAVAAQSKNMINAFKNTKTAVAELGEILKDSSKLNAFPPEVVSQISAAAEEYKSLSAAADIYKKQLASIDAEANKPAARTLQARAANHPGQVLLNSLLNGNTNDTAQRKQSIEIELKATNDSMLKLGESLKNISQKSLDYAFAMVLSKFDNAMAQRSIDISKAYLSYLPKSENTINLQVELENKSIEIRRQEIRALYENTQQMKITTTTAELLNIKAKQDQAYGGEKKQYQPEIDRLQKQIDLYSNRDIAGSIRSGALEKTPEAYEEARIQAGVKASDMQLVTQEKVNVIKGKMDKYILGLDNQSKQDQDFLKDQKASNDEVLASTDYASKSIRERAKIEEDYANKTLAARLREATKAESRDVSITQQAILEVGPDSREGRKYSQDLVADKQRQKAAIDRFFIEENTTRELKSHAAIVAEITAKYVEQNLLSKEAFDKSTQDTSNDIKALDSAQQLLDLKHNMSLIDDESYKAKTDSLKADKIELDYLQQLINLENTRQTALTAIEEEKAKASEAGPLPPELQRQFDIRARTAQDTYTRERKGVDSVTDGLREQQKLTESMSLRMQGYSSIVEGAFKNMADAIADFAKTGKLDFQGLINSMIADLLRFELETRAKEAYTGMGSLTGILGKFLGTAGSAAATSTSNLGATFDISHFSAQGNAYDHGVQAFAKGGTFSNSIVDSPTLFKFASGTGLMGEAGPEAIMPLKRDSNGTLGVQNHQGGGGGNVDVTVHNYGTEKAQTKESTDARGNRKIEIVIGEAAATDLTTNGSASQKAMGGTYGMRPQLIRR